MSSSKSAEFDYADFADSQSESFSSTRITWESASVGHSHSDPVRYANEGLRVPLFFGSHNEISRLATSAEPRKLSVN